MKNSFLIASLSLLFTTTFLEAHKPYQATIAVPPISSHVSATNMVNLKRNIQTAFDELEPFYTPTSAVALNIDLRGIQNIAAFAANSTNLIVIIPQANIVETFDGGTRDASLSLYKDYIRDAAHGHLLKAYARYSPIDPLAGNPTSLMSQMGQSDYLLGHLSPLSGCDCSWESQPIRHQFQAGTDVERAFVSGFDTTLVTAPLRYSYSPNRKWALILDAPLTFISNGGAYSVYGSLGTGIRVPVTSFWSLTPILRFGFGGSLDLCTSGAFFSAGLTSVLNYKFRHVVVSMTNYAAYLTSTNLWLSGINFNYHLQNYVFKNGLSVTTCDALQLFERPVNFNAFFIDSYYAREHLYIRHFDEFGLSMIINNVNPCLDYDCATFGFSYQFGEHHFRGYKFNLDYQF
jgi:hypothetical protein